MDQKRAIFEGVGDEAVYTFGFIALLLGISCLGQQFVFSLGVVEFSWRCPIGS
jgi:hypothetical protein